MNIKYLCRVVTNAYLSYSSKDFLGIQIEQLRENKSSGIAELDYIFSFHKRMMQKDIEFIDIIKFYNNIGDNYIVIGSNFYLALQREFQNQNYSKIIQIIKEETNSKYNNLLIELLINNLYFKIKKKFLIIRGSTLEKVKTLSSNEIICKFEEVSNKYCVKRKILSFLDIEKMILNLKKDLKNIIELKSVYLFGSYAKGKQDQYSDLDLIIVVNSNVDLRTLKIIIQKYFNDNYGIDVDLILKKDLNVLTNFESNVLAYSKKIL